MRSAPLPFSKLSGSGNDFVIVDNRSGTVPPEEMAFLAGALCRPRVSVGADGAIFIMPDAQYHFSWRFFNADGGEAEMCGNGSRCVARYAHERGIAPAAMTFRTLAGPVSARVEGARVRVRLTPPGQYGRNVSIDGDGATIHVDVINTGVPHAVLYVDDLEAADVEGLGRFIRRHPAFAPAGTNVNFVAVAPSFAVRTYERGVEGETLACGTGVVASAICAVLRGLAAAPVRARVRSGEVLTVDFPAGGRVPEWVDFEGEVRWIMDGTASPEAWDVRPVATTAKED